MEFNPNGARPEQPIPAQVITPRPRRPRRTALLVLLLLMGLGGSAILNLVLLVSGGVVTGADDKIREELFSNYEFKSGKHKIAIISLEGTILSGEGPTRRQIERAARDDDVKAVVTCESTRPAARSPEATTCIITSTSFARPTRSRS